ncbi:hypothetical protein [Prosthecobacter sp.]|uniref:hypothetical protein n=1 Tax=Prosthecobacter sp. TaxID=1965333 RepID=UPI003784610C
MNDDLISDKLKQALHYVQTGEGGFDTPLDLPGITFQRLVSKLGGRVRVTGPTGPTSSLLVISVDGVEDAIWLSYNLKLAAIIYSDQIEDWVRNEIQSILSEDGWTIVPESVAFSEIPGHPSREDWFSVLFGYD